MSTHCHCRLIRQLRTHIATAAAAAATAAPAAARAAADLAVFFPLPELLSLTQQSLIWANAQSTPDAADGLIHPGPLRVIRLGLNLTEALVAVWSGSSSGAVSELRRGLYTPEVGSEGGKDGVRSEQDMEDAWGSVIKGLLGLALADSFELGSANAMLLRVLSLDSSNHATVPLSR